MPMYCDRTAGPPMSVGERCAVLFKGQLCSWGHPARGCDGQLHPRSSLSVNGLLPGQISPSLALMLVQIFGQVNEPKLQG